MGICNFCRELPVVSAFQNLEFIGFGMGNGLVSSAVFEGNIEVLS